MTIDGSSYRSSEFIPAEEIEAAEKFNTTYEKAVLQEKAHCFRAAILEKMTAHNALEASAGSGWAIFRTDSREADTNVMTRQPDREVLVLLNMIDGRQIAGQAVPVIRIITNEMYADEHGDETCFSIDFSLDGYDDAQYFISSSEWSDFDIKGPATPESDNWKERIATWFWVRDNQLICTSNLRDFSPDESIEIDYADPVTGETITDEMYPLGSYKFISDSFDALAVGEELLRDIQHLDPEHVYVNGQRPS